MDPNIDPRIARSVARMEETLDRPARIPDLAAAAGLSESRFAHLFREQTGVPPARYLHALRMQRARVLLERTFLSVKDVMARVGFRDPSHFARDFRRFHGVAPTAARRAGAGAAPAAPLEPLVPFGGATAGSGNGHKPAAPASGVRPDDPSTPDHD